MLLTYNRFKKLFKRRLSEDGGKQELNEVINQNETVKEASSIVASIESIKKAVWGLLGVILVKIIMDYLGIA